MSTLNIYANFVLLSSSLNPTRPSEKPDTSSIIPILTFILAGVSATTGVALNDITVGAESSSTELFANVNATDDNSSGSFS